MRAESVIASIVAAALAASASAGVNAIRLDINGAATNSGGPFAGVAHTGALVVSNDANTSFVGASLNANPVVPTGAVSFLNTVIDTVLGATTGGVFTIILDQGETLTGALSGGGSIFPQAGEGFSIDSLVFTATFSNLIGGTHFGGVNVGQFGTSFSGSFLLSAYGPDANGFDDSTNIEIFLDIPTPGSFALAALAGLTAIRRRR
ncbi:MAG: hypothetical protein AB7G17_10715 [Phycisphaerales bacterium]